MDMHFMGCIVECKCVFWGIILEMENMEVSLWIVMHYAN